MFMYWVHNIKPYFFKLGTFELRYYGLMYIVAFFLFYFWFRYLIREGKLPITQLQLENLFTWAIIGVLAGGRLGYVLFYNPSYYLLHPVDILKTWQGGMSFHGGTLGVIIAFIIWSRKQKTGFWELISEVAVIAPFGMFFGRLGNFLNGELYGRVTDVPWAVIFPDGGMLPRHPSQLYQALLEGLLLGLLTMYFHFQGARPLRKFAVGVSGYALARIAMEFFRQPDEHLGFLAGGWLTMGQTLSFAMFAIGAGIYIYDAMNPEAVLPTPVQKPEPENSGRKQNRSSAKKKKNLS